MQQRKRENYLRNVDWSLVSLMMGLILFGAVAIANATLRPLTGDEAGLWDVLQKIDWTFVRGHLMFMGIGLAGTVVICCFDIHLYGRFSAWIMLLALLLLAVVLTQEPINNSRSWFKIGNNTFQPSEVGKLALIVALAHRVSRKDPPVASVKELVLLLPWVLVPVVLIVLQPDYGSAMVYLFIFIFVIFMSGMSLKLFIAFLSACALTAVPLWFLIGNEAQNRIRVFIDPVAQSSAYQTDHARIAVGSGQFGGKGFFARGALSQLRYVPESQNDFIFSVTAEAIGFLGCILLVGVFALFLWRMLRIAATAQDRFSRLVVSGVAAMFLFHIFENIAMNIGLMPVTGIPLPFISSGGSNLVANILAVGLVLNVRLRRAKKGIYDLSAP